MGFGGSKQKSWTLPVLYQKRGRQGLALSACVFSVYLDWYLFVTVNEVVQPREAVIKHIV
jgi:hypothetical protein